MTPELRLRGEAECGRGRAGKEGDQAWGAVCAKSLGVEGSLKGGGSREQPESLV